MCLSKCKSVQPVVKNVAIACVLFCVASAYADTKITNRLRVAGQSIDSSVYVKGNKARTEMHFPDGEMVRVESCGSAGATVLHINDHNRTYFYERAGSQLPGIESHAPAVTVMSTTTVTGEKKQILGREARHVKTEIHTVSASEACGGNTQMIADGWYVDLDFLPRCVSQDVESLLRDRLRMMGCTGRLRFQSASAPLTGYPLALDITLQQTPGKNAQPSATPTTIHQETLDISTVPAGDDLFLPPDGYREVKSMTELLNGSGSGATVDDEERLTEQRAHAKEKPKVEGTIRIGVAYPQFEADSKLSPETIRQQVAAELQAQGFDSVQLDSEIKEDALKECKPKQCDDIMLVEVTVDHGAKSSGSGNTTHRKSRDYEIHVNLTVTPLNHPARHLDTEAFYSSPDEKVSATAAIQQAVKTVKEQIDTLK